jgi:hypothetical protein
MASRIVPLLFLGLAAASAGASAETYKWVDARGIVNYSNSPPAAAAAARVQTVEQRISVVGPDPSVGLAAAALREREARRAETEEREWRQRQSALLAAQQQQMSASAYCVYGPDCGVSYYPEIYDPYYYGYPAFYGSRYGGGRLIGRFGPHPAPHLRKGSSLHSRGLEGRSFHSRGVAMHGGARLSAHGGRGGAAGGRGSPR